MLGADQPLQSFDARRQGDRAHVPPGRRQPEQVPRGAELEQEVDTELVAHLVRQAPTGFVIGER